MMAKAPEALRLEGVVKRFGGLTAVRQVSFAVPANSIVAVIGPNGAGKTTLFHLISGFHRLDAGRIYFRDAEITNLPPEQIASAGAIRTFQIVRLFGQMTALENVLVGFHLNTHGSVLSAIIRFRWFRDQEKRIHKQAHDLLDLVGLTQLGQMPARNLTYGQQRLLEIARALAGRPKLLMLDEPAAGLNTAETRDLMALIRRIREDGVTVLLVEHDMSLVMSLADEIHVINFGERIASGRPEDIQVNPAVIEAYLGSSAAKVGSIAHV